MSYSYSEMELMTENATLKERCAQLEKQVKVYTDLIAVLAKNNVTVPPTVNPNPAYPYRPEYSLSQGCPKCGLGADGKATGYACTRSDCPTGVTC
jgi:hypothetical protein